MVGDNTASEVTAKRGRGSLPRQIVQAPTAVLAVIGIAERGPVETLVELGSFAEFELRFGGYTPNNLETVAPIEGAFAGGIQRLFFVRTVHHAIAGDPKSKTSTAAKLTLQTAAAQPSSGVVIGTLAEPFALKPNDTITLLVDGQPDQTATIQATPASMTAGNAGPYPLADGDTLTVDLPGLPPVDI